MFNSLRYRLWLSYLVVILVALGLISVGFFLFYTRGPINNAYLRMNLNLNRVLLFEDLISKLPPENLLLTLERINENSSFRVLLLNAEGELIADSRRSELPPIIESTTYFMSEESGTVQDVAGQEWLYVSRQLRGGRYIIMVTPRPRFLQALLQGFQTFRDELASPMMRAGLIALLLGLLLAFWITNWVSAPLRKMSEATKAIAAGKFVKIKPEGPAEVKNLGVAFNDMTDRVKASQMSQREFVANVSHELKTPLTSIQGFAQAIMDGAAQDQDKAAQIIYQEADRMHRLVVNLLDLARLDAGTADLERAPVELANLLNDVALKFMPIAERAQVHLQTQIDPLPGFIGDGDRLAQVFTNLIENAIKHTPPGGQVILSARREGEQVEISVRDNGSGIPADELSRIFERFYQLDKARTGGKERGVGLGLAIAREIIHAHRGQIHARSQVGQGSNFIVRLPVAHPEDSTLALSKPIAD